MRLSEWRKTAPNKESLSNPVLAILKPVLVDLGAEADADCWVCWGDDPEARYSILAPTIAGLVTVAVRIAGPDNVRAMARLVRWSKVSVSELSIDASDGHRLVAVQVETLVLKGVDAEADRICEFVRGLVAGIENRSPQLIPIAVGQVAGAAAGFALGPGAVPGSGSAVDGEAAPSKGPAVSKSTPATPAEVAKPALKPVPKPVAKPVAKSAELVPMPVPLPAPASAPDPAPAPPPAPEAPAPELDAPVKPFAPTPIAARAAVAQKGNEPGVAQSVPVAEQPGGEGDPGRWIGPHSIEEAPGKEPNRPRRWTP